MVVGTAMRDRIVEARADPRLATIAEIMVTRRVMILTRDLQLVLGVVVNMDHPRMVIDAIIAVIDTSLPRDLSQSRCNRNWRSSLAQSAFII
jgi:hypothetical protein